MVGGKVDRKPVFCAKDVLVEWLAAARWFDPCVEATFEPRTSRAVRYARVVSLLGAFGLGSPKTFSKGSFLEDRAPPTLPRTLTWIKKFGQELDGLPPEFRLPFWTAELCHFFSMLLNYRTAVERVLPDGSGVLVAGPAMSAALSVAALANAGVAAAMAEVDALLVEMIASPGREVTEREMIDRWSWPEADPDELFFLEQF